jgi:hypothetical protein
LFFGENPKGSAPSLSISRLLSKCGHQVLFDDAANVRVKPWLELLRRADAAICIHYGKFAWRTARVLVQAQLAAAIGTPVVRWWEGSDVWSAQQDSRVLHAAQQLDRYVSANLAVAPNLRDHLARLGIRASVLAHPVLDLPEEACLEWNSVLAHSVLVYLPARRAEFYGAHVLNALIPMYQDLTFYLVANDGQRFKGFSNVVSLGWVEDMGPVYEQVGCLLRITPHDANPRMVREALARARYVVFSHPYEGCLLARNLDEVNAALSEVTRKAEPNLYGTEVIRRTEDAEAFIEQFGALIQEVRARRWRKSPAAVVALLPDVVRSLQGHSSFELGSKRSGRGEFRAH